MAIAPVGRVLLPVVAAIAVFAAPVASGASPRTITVHGTGTVKTTPTTADFTFGVAANAETASAALAGQRREDEQGDLRAQGPRNRGRGHPDRADLAPAEPQPGRRQDPQLHGDEHGHRPCPVDRQGRGDRRRRRQGRLERDRRPDVQRPQRAGALTQGAHGRDGRCQPPRAGDREGGGRQARRRPDGLGPEHVGAGADRRARRREGGLDAGLAAGGSRSRPTSPSSTRSSRPRAARQAATARSTESNRPGNRSSSSARRSRMYLLVPCSRAETIPAVVQRLEVVARGRLRDRDLDLAALQLARSRAAGELAHDLEPDRIRERLQHGQHVDLVEVDGLDRLDSAWRCCLRHAFIFV